VKDAYELWEYPEKPSQVRKAGVFGTITSAIDATGIDPSMWLPSPRGGLYIPVPDGDSTGRCQSWMISPARVPETDADRIELAIQLALDYGQIDGHHHKMWVIDQMLRVLVGDRYKQVVTDYCSGEDGPETYEWYEGIAP
jgi:hypothetical protein